MSEADYEKTGLKVGLEIHQQLNTVAKLFCNCKPELFKDEPEIAFLRRLRPTQSELGQIDPAAYFEFQKGVRILYEANRTTSCLVEMDEEPPHRLNPEAVRTALTVAFTLGSAPVDEIHVMRKTVIDGSNTTGFQRTCVVALGGEMKVGHKVIPIEHISLEEDAARKTGEESKTIRYRIDRLGVPLIEIATAPVITSPKEAEGVAFSIGRILRATGKVMRGLGTIRQDINISVPNGALVEIKGLQELDLIGLVVEYELQRQSSLIEISKILNEIGMNEDDIKEELFDVTNNFKHTRCKVIQKALEQKHKVLAVKLPKFKGLLRRELMPNFRLGTEMADRARFWGRVGGIFHTDELPAYGITSEDVSRLRKTIGARDEDVVVFVADAPDSSLDALRAVLERSREAIRGVPEETRGPNPDGTTRYMRPRPGSARMYPETDIPPTQITEELLKETSSQLPELPEQKLERLMKDYKLNEKLAKQVMDSEYGDLFQTIVEESKVSPTTVAVFMTETLKALKREGFQVGKVSESQMREIFRQVGSGDLTKEAVPEIVSWLSKNEGKAVQQAIESTGVKVLSIEELEEIVEAAFVANKKLVDEKGTSALGVLMGIVMKGVRGRADPKKVSNLIKKKLAAL